MAKAKLKIIGIDNGFCRIDYLAHSNGKNFYYCIQEEYEGFFECYRCSSDHEPQSPVICNKGDWEVPKGDSTIEKTVRDFLTFEMDT